MLTYTFTCILSSILIFCSCALSFFPLYFSLSPLHMSLLHSFAFVTLGLRCVHPYDYVFNTFTKRRWVGKPILEVFESEFQSESAQYYVSTSFDGEILQ